MSGDITSRIADILRLNGDLCTRANAEQLAETVVAELGLTRSVLTTFNGEFEFWSTPSQPVSGWVVDETATEDQ